MNTNAWHKYERHVCSRLRDWIRVGCWVYAMCVGRGRCCDFWDFRDLLHKSTFCGTDIEDGAAWEQTQFDGGQVLTSSKHIFSEVKHASKMVQLCYAATEFDHLQQDANKTVILEKKKKVSRKHFLSPFESR